MTPFGYLSLVLQLAFACNEKVNVLVSLGIIMEIHYHVYRVNFSLHFSCRRKMKILYLVMIKIKKMMENLKIKKVVKRLKKRKVQRNCQILLRKLKNGKITLCSR